MIAIIFWVCIGIIVYTYAGYPVLLSILAHIRKKPVAPQPHEPTLTLLIAAYNEESCLKRKLDNALDLDYPSTKLQILVTDDGSEDHTPDIVRSYVDRGVELCRQHVRQGKMAAINQAMELARGDIVIFSDANNLYETGTLRELVLPFTDPNVGGVNGSRHILKDDDALSESEGLYWKYESYIKKQETLLSSCTAANGEIFAIRRCLYEPAPKGIINDDFYLAMRLLRRGYRIVYSHQARSFERVSLSAEDEIIRRTRINAGRYQAISLAFQILPINRPVLIWQVFSHKFLRLLVPFAMIGAFLANLAALLPIMNPITLSLWLLSPPFNWIIFILQTAFYLVAWAGNTFKPAGKLGKIFYLPAFLVNSNLAALKGFIGFITGRQTALWKRVKRIEEKGGNHV
jgi:poly-beta-1,6-N-acetyl-D-glucosamine synthase